MTEVYIYFDYEEYGYKPGDIVKCELLGRDDKGVHVSMLSGREHRESLNAWSDLAGFHELNEMEVIAHAVAGTSFL